MIIGLENQFSVFLRVAILHRFYCIKSAFNLSQILVKMSIYDVCCIMRMSTLFNKNEVSVLYNQNDVSGYLIILSQLYNQNDVSSYILILSQSYNQNDISVI